MLFVPKVSARWPNLFVCLDQDGTSADAILTYTGTLADLRLVSKQDKIFGHLVTNKQITLMANFVNRTYRKLCWKFLWNFVWTVFGIWCDFRSYWRPLHSCPPSNSEFFEVLRTLYEKMFKTKENSFGYWKW